jgi:phospholipase/lecithinase/hemolysin
MKRIVWPAAAGVLWLALSPVTARAYSAIYVFGDSLSDAGNVYIGTGGKEPAAPYYQGEFSNGPISIEDLSHSLGLGPVLPSLAGGTDYAFGGATTGYQLAMTPPPQVPTVTQQVALFESAVSGHAPSSALYSVWIGSNDVLNIVGSAVSLATATVEAQGAANTEAAAIKALAAAGAKDFLIPLVGNLGDAPELTQLGAAASAAGTALALTYDAALEADLAQLAATPGIDLTILDTFTLLTNAVKDPTAFGLTNATVPCYVGTYFGGGSVCADPGQYLFWDTLHPTAAGQAIIAQAALNALPEPASIAVLATGIAAIASLRRRSRRGAA